jgi:hypothetical protein
MKILTSGCSFSRGPTAWTNHVAKLANAELVNLAQAGAGNTYISRSILHELQHRTYDLVLVMWSGLERIDVQVSDIQQFSETSYTSNYQSKQNDWPEKIVCPVNDQDYVQKNWVFGVGHLNGDKTLLKSGLFDKLYRYQGFDEHLQRSLYDMISLENYLKFNSIPYVFSFYQNYIRGNCFDCLDWNNIFNEDNLFDLTKIKNDYDADGIHPGPKAQEEWANRLYKFLKKSERL